MQLGIAGLGDVTEVSSEGAVSTYRASWGDGDQDVTVKVIDRRDQQFVDRFRRQGDALIPLSRSPRIVTVHEVGATTDGRPYLIVDPCDPSLLDRVAEQGPIDVGEASQIMAVVTEAVADAHLIGIIHEGLGPGVIVGDGKGAYQVADFGVAVLVEAGSGPYRAPEFDPTQKDDPAVDVYALGTTLLHLVTGTSPEEGSPLNTLPPGPLHDVIEASMASEPVLRPTMSELRRSLRELHRLAPVSKADASETSVAEVESPTTGVDPTWAPPTIPPTPFVMDAAQPDEPAVEADDEPAAQANDEPAVEADDEPAVEEREEPPPPFVDRSTSDDEWLPDVGGDRRVADALYLGFETPTPSPPPPVKRSAAEPRRPPSLYPTDGPSSPKEEVRSFDPPLPSDLTDPTTQLSGLIDPGEPATPSRRTGRGSLYGTNGTQASRAPTGPVPGPHDSTTSDQTDRAGGNQHRAELQPPPTDSWTDPNWRPDATNDSSDPAAGPPVEGRESPDASDGTPSQPPVTHDLDRDREPPPDRHAVPADHRPGLVDQASRTAELGDALAAYAASVAEEAEAKRARDHGRPPIGHEPDQPCQSVDVAGPSAQEPSAAGIPAAAGERPLIHGRRIDPSTIKQRQQGPVTRFEMPPQGRSRWKDFVDDASIVLRGLIRALLGLAAVGILLAGAYYVLVVRADEAVEAVGEEQGPTTAGILAAVVPVVASLPQEQAIARLENAGFRMVVSHQFDIDVARGAVVSSDPAAGTSAEVGSTISLMISRGSEPNCVGSTEQGVRRQLEERELTVAGINRTHSDTIALDLVVRCVIYDESDTAIIVVSDGPRAETEDG